MKQKLKDRLKTAIGVPPDEINKGGSNGVGNGQGLHNSLGITERLIRGKLNYEGHGLIKSFKRIINRQKLDHMDNLATGL